MTNTFFAIISLVSTNWTPLGTFVPFKTNSPTTIVKSGRYQTNLIASFKYGGVWYDLPFKTNYGPECGLAQLPQPDVITVKPVRFITITSAFWPRDRMLEDESH